MNRATTLHFLIKAGKNSSAELRAVCGLTVKGTNISGHLSTLTREGYVKKTQVGGVNKYAATKEGRSWLSTRMDQVETIEEINSRDYTKGTSKKKAPALPMTSTEEGAIGGLVAVIEENKALRATIKDVMIRLQTALGE